MEEDVTNEVKGCRGWNSRRMRTRKYWGPASVLDGLWLMLLLYGPLFSEAQSPPAVAPPACPLNFTLLNQYPSVANTVKSSDKNNSVQCDEIDRALETVISLYLRDSGYFLVPKGTSTACINAYQSQLESQGVPSGFNISKSCGLSPFLSERGTDLCHNIQSAQDFRSSVPVYELEALNSSCSGSLQRTSDCGSCNTAITPIVNQLAGRDNSSCTAFVNIYATGIANLGGPSDPYTALCIFYIEPNSGGGNKNLKYIAVGVGGMLFICIVAALLFYYKYWRKIKANREARKKRTQDLLSATSVPTSSINWFDIDELKRATGNFSRNNILGTGGFGNVYKGTLPDGSVVAVKRFKNCSPAGDKDFVHEVEMISSVKHRHLVEIRGCCVDDSSAQYGHQRMIVYDLMSNGSLHDHLFWKDEKPGGVVLSWIMRRKIAIGMAKGLAYLHHDAVPAIFHRDIKSSNILLDEEWNARLADFGLAKFTPEGVSHVTTRVQGTYGYIAPEYALYGQMTEKSDVYSFGIVILELATGRKALSANDPQHTLLADWAWPLVKQGKWRDIVDPRMGDDLGSDAEMESFILVGLLCAHPQVFYRPSMDQALKMLENGAFSIPSVPDRPLPFTSNQDEIHQALSQESLEHRDRSSRTGYSSYSFGSVSFHSEYSGSLTSSYYERKVSSERSNQWSEASASQPSSLYEKGLYQDRSQDMASHHQSADNLTAQTSSLVENLEENPAEEKVLPDRTQVDDDHEKMKSKDTSREESDLEKGVLQDRTQVSDHEKMKLEDSSREGSDLEKGVLPDRTQAYTGI